MERAGGRGEGGTTLFLAYHTVAQRTEWMGSSRKAKSQSLWMAGQKEYPGTWQGGHGGELGAEGVVVVMAVSL